MAGYIGTQAVSVNTTSATISDDLTVGDDLTVTDDVTIGGALTADGGVIFNEAGEAAPDFRVESNSFDHMFFINGGLNNTAIGFNALPENQGAGLGILTGSGDGGVHLFREDGSFPSADESLGSFGWSGADSSGSLSTADAKITAFANENMAAGDAGTNIQFYTKANGVNQGTAPTRAMVIASTGQVRFEDGTASLPSISNSGDTNTGIFFPAADKLTITTGGTSRLEVDDAGNVGIGGAPNVYSGYTNLTINHATNGGIIDLELDGNVTGELFIDSAGFHLYAPVADDDITFRGNDGGSGQFTALTLDMSAAGAAKFNSDVFIGTTDGDPTGNHVPGALISAGGQINVHRDGGNPLRVGQSADGNLTEFYRQGALVGQISVLSNNHLELKSAGSNLNFYVGGTRHVRMDSARLYPSADDAYDLGLSSNRFDDIFATNGTINTSDRNEKQDIAALTSAEMLVAKRISSLFKTFRWKDKVAAKGDKARTHSGIIAQDVQAAFTAESLDAGDYSLFISSTWWEHDVDVAAVEAADAADAVYREVTDSDGIVTNELVTSAKDAVESKDAYTRTDNYNTQSEAPEGATSRTRLGIRYPELLSFLAAYNEQRFAAIETRLTALEG